MLKNKEEKFLKLNIQYFADGGEGEGEETPPAGETIPEGTYTEEDFQKRLGEEIEKAVSKHAEELEAAKTEAEKLAKMNAAEKAEHDFKKREQALLDKESNIAARELKAETLKTLSDKQLPSTVIDIVLAADAESTSKNIDAFKDVFDNAVQTAVEERLSGKSPTVGNGGGAKAADEQARETFANALKGVI